MKRWLSNLLILLTLATIGIGVTGCKSPDSENVSSRPWNAPRGFDSGLPGYDYQRRPY